MNQSNVGCDPQGKHLEAQLTRFNEQISELEALQETTSKAIDRLLGSPAQGEGDQGLAEASVGEPFVNRLEQAITRLQILRSRVEQDTDRLSDVV